MLSIHKSLDSTPSTERRKGGREGRKKGRKIEREKEERKKFKYREKEEEGLNSPQDRDIHDLTFTRKALQCPCRGQFSLGRLVANLPAASHLRRHWQKKLSRGTRTGKIDYF